MATVDGDSLNSRVAGGPTDEVVKRVVLRVVEKGMPVDDEGFNESEEVRALVRKRLLFLAGIKPTEEEKETHVPDAGLGIESKTAEGPPVLIAEPAQIIIQAGLGEKRPFKDISGSYGPDAPDVKLIANAHNRGYPVAVYEFMQGMVDYGKGHEPPPRIWIEYQNGERCMYDGNGEIVQKHDNPIRAIEFTNGGSGMPPEDVIINRHGGDEGTLGEYGKGLTLALNYLAMQGMTARVSSHCETGSWSGELLLVPTETNVAKVLVMRGEWVEPQAVKTTTIRIEKPTNKFIKEVSGVGDFFLYANPKFPEATIVERDEKAQGQTEKAIPIDRGHVMRLEGIVLQKNDGTHDYIFIDGLKVPIGSKRTIFPWSIQGLGKADAHSLRVKRSHNSMAYEAFEISTPILLAVQRLTDKPLLRRLIVHIMKDWNTEYLEFMRTYRGSVDLTIAEVTAGLVREIWKEEYGEGTIISKAEQATSWYKKFAKEKKAVVHVPEGLYEFLARAGVSTVESENAVMDVISMEGLNTLSVPSANSPNKFDKMMDYVTQIGGKAELVEAKGSKKMMITIPKVVRTLEEFNGQVEYSDGIVIRTIAVIACSEGLDVKGFAVNGDHVYEIQIGVGGGEKGVFSTTIEIKVIEKNKLLEYAEFASGKTYLVLSGEQIAAFCQEDPVKVVAAKEKEKEKKKSEMPKYDRETGEIFKDEPEKKVGKKTIGQIKITNREESNGEAHKESKYPNGYYKKETGSVVSYNKEDSSGYWSHEYNWSRVEIPAEKLSKYYSAHVIDKLKSKGVQLLVPAGHKIAGIKTSDLAKFKVYRDTRTGQYLIAGVADKLIYYTCPDNGSGYDRQAPVAAEKEDVLKMVFSLLLPEWRDFIEIINANPTLNVHNKIALAQEQWNRKFIYDDDYGLNEQIKGSNAEEVAAKILNASRGICNLSATGFALLLRAIGIPSRVVTGYWKQRESAGGRHMWVEYWNGARWVAHETEIGVRSAAEVEEGSISEVVERLREQIRTLNERIDVGQRKVKSLLQAAPVLITRQGFKDRIQKELGAFMETK